MVSETYRVVLHAKPAVGLKESVRLNLNFETNNGSVEAVTVCELFEMVEEQAVQVGLELHVDVFAKTPDEAITKAGHLADGVASFITLSTGVGTPIIKPVLCYETTQGKTERPFLQFFDNLPFRQPPRKVLAHEQLIDLIGKFRKVSDKDAAERVARAIRWYRLGTASTDIFDRFGSYWIGLESLNKPLQDALGVKDDPVKCPKCEHEWVLFPTVSGIREFVRRYFENGSKLYQRMHAIRINVMHSKTRLDSILYEVTAITPLAGNVLAGAIYYLLGINPPWTFPKEILSNAFPFRLVLEANIVSDRIEDAMLDGETDPHFEAEHALKTLQSDTGGKTNIKMKSKFKAIIGPRASFSAYAIRLYGEGKGTLTVSDVS